MFTEFSMFYVYLIVSLFGGLVGSFLNVCIYRIPNKKSIVYPPSSCMSCNAKIKFYDNVPILSYLILKGKCRSCGVSLSVQYPIVEFLTGFFAFIIFYEYGFTSYTVAGFIFVSALIVITFIDLNLRIIPDVITLPLIPIAFVASFFIPLIEPLDSFIGFLAGGGGLYLIAFMYEKISARQGLGGGDIKLLAMIGAFLGWKGVLVTVFLSSFIGAIIGVVLMGFYGKDSKFAIPFGPFLSLGATFYMLYGTEFLNWYLQTMWKL